MTVTAASFKAFFAPTFDATLDATITLKIAEAERRTSRDAWGAKADDGVSYLVAHLLSVAAGNTTGGGAVVRGPLTSETVGPLSRSFAAPAAVPFTMAWYGSTGYGAAYLELMGLIFSDRVGEL